MVADFEYTYHEEPEKAQAEALQMIAQRLDSIEYEFRQYRAEQKSQR